MNNRERAEQIQAIAKKSHLSFLKNNFSANDINDMYAALRAVHATYEDMQVFAEAMHTKLTENNPDGLSKFHAAINTVLCHSRKNQPGSKNFATDSLARALLFTEMQKNDFALECESIRSAILNGTKIELPKYLVAHFQALMQLYTPEKAYDLINDFIRNVIFAYSEANTTLQAKQTLLDQEDYKLLPETSINQLIAYFNSANKISNSEYDIIYRAVDEKIEHKVSIGSSLTLINGELVLDEKDELLTPVGISQVLTVYNHEQALAPSKEKKKFTALYKGIKPDNDANVTLHFTDTKEMDAVWQKLNHAMRTDAKIARMQIIHNASRVAIEITPAKSNLFMKGNFNYLPLCAYLVQKSGLTKCSIELKEKDFKNNTMAEKSLESCIQKAYSKNLQAILDDINKHPFDLMKGIFKGKKIGEHRYSHAAANIKKSIEAVLLDPHIDKSKYDAIVAAARAELSAKAKPKSIPFFGNGVFGIGGRSESTIKLYKDILKKLDDFEKELNSYQPQLNILQNQAVEIPITNKLK